MADLYQELQEADYKAELNMLAYQEWVEAELEKEATEAYQLNNDERNALNKHMEGSDAFNDSRNHAIISNNNVIELYNRKTRRKTNLQTKIIPKEDSINKADLHKD